MSEQIMVCKRCGKAGHLGSQCPRGALGAIINGAQLTVVETRTLSLMAIGLSNRQIAKTSCVAASTIDDRVRTMQKKLCISGRVRLAVMAHKVGLCDIYDAGELRICND